MATDNQNVCKIGLDPIKMGGLFEKVDNIDETTQRILVKVGQQNGRIGKLEKWQAKIIGIGLTLLLLEPFIMKYIFMD